MCDRFRRVALAESICLPVCTLVWVWVVSACALSYADSPAPALAYGNSSGMAEIDDGFQVESLPEVAESTAPPAESRPQAASSSPQAAKPLPQAADSLPQPEPVPNEPDAPKISFVSSASSNVFPEPASDASPATSARPMSTWQSCSPSCRCGVACPPAGCSREPGWRSQQLIPWQMLAHGEYIGPARSAHVPVYHLRVDDVVRCVYGLTGNPSPQPYQLDVGDVVKIEAVNRPDLNREALIQPDGALTLPLIGTVPAASHTLAELRDDVENRYKQFVKEPQISITPVKVNTRVEELRLSVDQRYGRGGQGVIIRINPAGTIQLPAIGSVPAQGLTLDELKSEIEARYNRRFYGVEVTPILEDRAPRYVYVVGEVKNPGRFSLEGPTTAMQAIALAGGWNVGANVRNVVVFRRDENWCLMATQLDLRPGLYGKRPCPTDEIWLRDSDLVLVPKSKILIRDEWIQLFFTRGLYGIVPFNVTAYTGLSTL